MHFARSNCEILFQDWINSKPDLVLAQQELGEVERFSYSDSSMSPSGRLSDEVSSHIQKARLTFANLRHLRRNHDNRLSVKRRACITPINSVLLCGPETWSWRADVQRYSAFEHRRLHNTGRNDGRKFLMCARFGSTHNHNPRSYSVCALTAEI